MTAPEYLPGHAGRRALIIADHASNQVPAGIELGLSDAEMNAHVAYDIGTAALAGLLSSETGIPAVLASVSRLVVDCNRAPSDPALIPPTSDGIRIPGNHALSENERIERMQRYYHPYHDAVDSALNSSRARLLVSIHSFTPALSTRPDEQRPWHVGLLYNRDRRAAAIAMRTLEAMDLTVGDNLPYSGARFGYTTDRHAEARGLPYLTFEVRQDLLLDQPAITEWAGYLADVIGKVESELFSELEEVST